MTWMNSPNSLAEGLEEAEADALRSSGHQNLLHALVTTVQLEWISSRSLLSPWVLSSRLCLPTRASEELLYSWRLNLAQIKESKLIGYKIHFYSSYQHFQPFYQDRAFLFSPFMTLGFLSCFSTLTRCEDGGSRNLARCLKVLAAIVPIRCWWLRAKGAGGEGSCLGSCWPAWYNRFRPAGRVCVCILNVPSWSILRRHTTSWYHASEAQEQHFSRLLWDLDLVVINVTLMLPCTSRAAFYLS